MQRYIIRFIFCFNISDSNGTYVQSGLETIKIENSCSLTPLFFLFHLTTVLLLKMKKFATSLKLIIFAENLATNGGF